jgi:hypothetical protein
VNELDEIMSGDSGAAPVETVTQQEQQPSQPRDDGGRFASTQAPEPVAGQPVVEQPVIEHPQPNGGVPVGAVQAEREKRQAAQAESEALRREIAELRGMVQATRQPAPQPQQEQQPASLWDDPDAYLKSQISPLEQRLLAQAANFSMRMAIKEHGKETFEAAEQALAQAANTPDGQQFISKLRASDDPAEDLIKWHKQQQAIARVGNDPDAWLNAELERRLSDPTEQAKILERIRTGAASNTNRSQAPLTSLPPSLSRMPAGGNAPADSDMSDGALFSHATR